MVSGIKLNKEQGEVDPTGHPFSSVIRALLYLAVCTRPDISFSVGMLAKFLSGPGTEQEAQQTQTHGCDLCQAGSKWSVCILLQGQKERSAF